ncbi:WD repeat-containing protein 26 [Madurella mycetomatis]|uniref:WD repeat-containing protein 26 n=1 Tax=Madurella mycetomatis TaxID=100816 RepID=A0A175VSY4_9PEZI|nr:WD repeat-containing protein 26 [Madurella mycetomatis]
MGGPVHRPPSSYFGHDREEITRILIQALDDLGYHAAAQSVGEESGFEVESRDVAAFRQAVLEGSWSRAEELLWGKGPEDGLVLAPGADRNAMRFWLRQQKFLELLEQRETARALAVLRTELTPLVSEQHQTLHLLSRFLMCQDAEDLRAKANWDGANGRSRHILLTQLLECISPSAMLPARRLAVLLDSVKRIQVGNCLYHTSDEPPSLYADHSCDRSLFPSEVVMELPQPGVEMTQQEIWQVRFSPDGKLLASCGSDSRVTIWDAVCLPSVRTILHPDSEVGNIAWSPDGKLLLTCGLNHLAKIFDVDRGECVRELERFDEPVSSCVWAADGQTFVTGSFDKSRSLCSWNLRGDRIHTWTTSHRTEDVALSPDQHWLAAMDDQRTVHLYNYETREHVYDLTVNARPSSLSISGDSRYMLVTKTDNEAVLIDIETRETMAKYSGLVGGQFTIRSAFGGANENFVISGSEEEEKRALASRKTWADVNGQDGRVLVWHKMTGTLVFEAEAHIPRCNSVAWDPTDHCTFVTCGDDGRIKM